MSCLTLVDSRELSFEHAVSRVTVYFEFVETLAKDRAVKVYFISPKLQSKKKSSF